MIFPPANLPPQSKQWKDFIENAIGVAASGLSKLTADVSNSFKAVSASLSALSAKQQQLDAQQASLAAQQAQIQTVISQLITTGSAGGSANNYGTSTSPVAVASGTITVPAGYGMVTVQNVIQSDFDGSGGGNFFYAAAGINGIGGSEAFFQSGSTGYGTVTAAAIRTFSVASLSSFTVEVRVRAQNATGSSSLNKSTFNAIAIFTK